VYRLANNDDVAGGQLTVFLRCSLDRYNPDSGTSLAPWKTAN